MKLGLQLGCWAPRRRRTSATGSPPPEDARFDAVFTAEGVRSDRVSRRWPGGDRETSRIQLGTSIIAECPDARRRRSPHVTGGLDLLSKVAASSSAWV